MKMMSVSTRKALADVTRRKGRTVLMILGIFISVLSLTAINGANDLFNKDLHNGISNSFDLFFSVDQEPAGLLGQLQSTKNVAAVQPRTAYQTTWHLSGNGGTTPLEILGYPDLSHVQSGTLQLISGRLPGSGEIVMDTSDTTYAPVALGDRVMISSDGRTVSLRVVGLIRSQGMAILAHSAQGYMSLDALQPLLPISIAAQQGPPLVQRQFLITTTNAADNEQTFGVVQAELAAAHVQTIASTYVAPQTEAGAQMLLSGFSIIFLSLAGLALLLTCILILTTINTMLAEQFRIIGTMKALGATRGRIMRGYLLTVGVYALIGTALGLGLGLLLCSQISHLVAQQTKLDLGPYQPAPGVILISLIAGLVVPELAALFPLWLGTRITVHQALASYGITTDRTPHIFTTRSGGTRLPQTFWLSLRGIFRKPVRAWLTILALALSAMTFMLAQTMSNSIGVAVEQTNFHSSDFEITLGNSPLPASRIIGQLAALPNVAQVEPFDHEDVLMGTHRTRIFGIPADSHFYTVHLVAGRWLQASEWNTLVISDIAAQRLHVQVGASLPFTKGSQQIHWKVVGIVHDLDNASGSADTQGRLGSMFTTLENLNINLRHIAPESALMLELSARDHSQATLQGLRGEIQQTLQQAKLWQGSVQYSSSGGGIITIVYALFDTIAIIVALVGLLGLSNTLATEVLERRKEIGILRSLGAQGRQVGLIFWTEGVALSVLAWLPGIVLAVPGSYALIAVMNTQIQPLNLVFNVAAIPLTLVFIVVVSFFASFASAWRASRVRIGEILRYE